eukprot:1673581-Heterocapsa_arctica.AAC.1
MPLRRPKFAQQAALDRVHTLYRRVPAYPAELTPAGALRELCGSASRYVPTEPSTVAPYTKDLVSWPLEGTKAFPSRTSSLGPIKLWCMIGRPRF